MAFYPIQIFLAILLVLTNIVHGENQPNGTTKDPVNEDDAKKYLQRFGYLQPSMLLQSPPSGRHVEADYDAPESKLANAVKNFQEFAGLKVTGALDVRTRKKMAEPRCGFHDVFAMSRRKVPVLKWNKSQLTYSILRFTKHIPEFQQRSAMRQAFAEWSAVTPLNFTELENDDDADIRISFFSGNHGDGNPFDGVGGVLAHATLPTDGILHFDNDENWVYMNADKIGRGYTDLLSVSIHEVGHTLGLPHFPVRNSIMAPFYQEPLDESGEYVKPTLKSIDINGIQEIYGSRVNVPSWRPTTTTVRPTTTKSYGDFFDRLWSKWFGGRENNGDSGRSRVRTTTVSPGGSDEIDEGPHVMQCPLSLDAIVQGLDGKLLVFDGNWVFQLDGHKVAKRYRLKEMFPGGPPLVKAALSDRNSRTLWLFNGFAVWTFRWDRTSAKYQLDHDSPDTLPEGIEFYPRGGMRWPNGRQLLFSCCGDIAVYDPFENEASAVGKLVGTLPEFPFGAKGGFVSTREENTVLVFTISRVYKYDTETKHRIGSALRFKDVITCDGRRAK